MAGAWVLKGCDIVYQAPPAQASKEVSAIHWKLLFSKLNATLSWPCCLRTNSRVFIFVKVESSTHAYITMFGIQRHIVGYFPNISQFCNHKVLLNILNIMYQHAITGFCAKRHLLCNQEFILRGGRKKKCMYRVLKIVNRSIAYHLRHFHAVDKSSHLLRALQSLGWILFITVQNLILEVLASWDLGRLAAVKTKK